AGVTATDDNYIFPGRQDLLVFDRISSHTFVLLRQKLHGKVNTLEVASGYRKVTWCRCATAKNDGVKCVSKMLCTDVHADMRICAEGNALLLHQADTAVNDMFLQLEIGDAVA